MDGQYLSFVSNDITNDSGTQREVLRVYPAEFRRVFEPLHSAGNNSQWKLKYSVTDVLVRIRTIDGPLVHLEAIKYIVDMSSVHFVALPADVVFDTTDVLEDDDVSWDKVKKIIFLLFPDIKLSNRYENRSIARPQQQGVRREILQTPRWISPEIPLVDAERVHVG